MDGMAGQRNGIGLRWQARQRVVAHATTTARPARSDNASDAWANDTTSAPARAATVRATRVTLCSPRALRPPARSLEARSSRHRERAAVRRPASSRPSGRRPRGRHDRRRLARRVREELIGIGPAERHDQVEAVEQRSGDAAPVAGPGGGAAAAGAFVDAFAAGAGIHGGHEEEGRGEGDGPAGAADPDDPFLERLAQRLERGDRELAELVEEQDAVGGQAHLAGPQGPTAAADQGDDGGLVMGGAEGRALEQLAVGEAQPADEWMRVTVSASAGVSGGSNPTRRSASIVFPEPGGPTIRRWCPPPRRLPRPVARAPDPARRPGRAPEAADSACRRGARPGRLAAQDGHQFAKRGGAAYVLSPHQRRLTDVTQRHDHAEGAAASARAIMPGTWRSEPFSPSSPQKERPSMESGLSSPAATSRPTAMGRSSPAPPLRTRRAPS